MKALWDSFNKDSLSIVREIFENVNAIVKKKLMENDSMNLYRFL